MYIFFSESVSLILVSESGKFQYDRRVSRGVPYLGTPLHVSCWASYGLANDVIEAVPFFMF